MTTRVFQSRPDGPWHWPSRLPGRNVAACSACPLRGDGVDPVSVAMADRCRGVGCDRLWRRWLYAAVQEALAEQRGVSS